MSKKAWLTVDSLPSAMKSLVFNLPTDDLWKAQARGALTPLMYPENFEQFGALTPEVQADKWREIILAFFEEIPMFLPGTIISYAGNSPWPDGWLYCDGNVYLISDYPDLFAVIGYNMGEVGNPDYFRVPDLRRRVPCGYHPSDPDFNTLGYLGGFSTHVLTVEELPSHNHTQNSHNHTQDSHNHTQNSHNHTQDSHNHTQDSHVHLQGAHNHGLDGGINAASGSVARGMIAVGGGSNNTTSRDSTASNQAATATNQAATATNQAATATNQAATATNQAATATNQAVGGGVAHNSLQPYQVVNYLIKT